MQKYPVTDVRNISPINTGVENRNYLIEAIDKRYVLRIYSHSHSIRGERTQESIELELEFMRRASNANIQIPHVIKNKQAEEITQIKIADDKYFVVLFTFQIGTKLEGYSEIAVKQVGQVVNQLFDVGNLFQPTASEMKNDILTRGFEQYGILLKSQLNIPPEINTLWLQVQLQKSETAAKSLSVGLVHGDLHLENMLFDENNTLKVILDFDDYRYSYLLEEFVTALMHNLHSTEENILRSGHYEIFLSEMKNPRLRTELYHCQYFLRIRFIYDVCNYLLAGNFDLVDELLQDTEIQKYILN